MSTSTSRIGAPRAADELGHPRLEVHPAHDPPPRAGVVVLDELVGDPDLGEGGAAVGLLEEAALVAVDDGLDQDRAVEADGQRPHQRPPRARWTSSSARSESTIISISCSKLTSGSQPSLVLALFASPMRCSTSAGRRNDWIDHHVVIDAEIPAWSNATSTQ